MRHRERHRIGRLGWLRAGVLGANDGLISTGSLIIGVAAAHASAQAIAITGVAGLVSGALSMAAGEYVSVQSQADAERADTAKERAELADQPDAELTELAGIYKRRGLAPELAQQVAVALTAHDALAAHLHDELNITDSTRARPMQAALSSAAAFSAGALPPLLLALFCPAARLVPAVTATTLLLLMALGALAARLGGASMVRGATRVLFWGALAMAATATIGKLLGATPAV